MNVASHNEIILVFASLHVVWQKRGNSRQNFVLAKVRRKDRGVICNICVDTTPLLSLFSQHKKCIQQTLLLVEYY
jgi:hypothetical protein